MARPLRQLLPWALLALLGAVSLAWLGLLGFVWTDYEVEAAPSLAALVDGHVGSFLQLAPAYGGSLMLRAPFALAAHGLGGGDVAVFRAVGLPCLLAGSALGLVLASSLLARGAGRGTMAIVVALCACNPITLRALDIGHPEELLGAALSAGAVLAALRGRPTLGRRAARARGRQQGVGAAGGRAGAAGAAGAAPAGAHDRVAGSRSRSWSRCCSRRPRPASRACTPRRPA